ncbi:MAG: carbohydrate binding family 9 domain-containing protein [Colwellia sp.]|nr:carbohydrate binding family 9 domain-containing protein [Colwellia sp.]
MFTVKFKHFLTISMFIFLTFEVSSEEVSQIPRISGKITIDAKLDEKQWRHAKRILMNNITRPYDNIPSPVHTEALLMEDGGTFYIAFIAEDPEPSQIRAFYRDRDRSWGDDIVGIKIDTYNDQRTAYRFLVNPLGSQIDGIENEITKRDSDSWDGIWDSAGQVNDKGYIVEMALPLRMLNFTEKSSIQDWGIELMRFYPRNESLRLSNIRLERDNDCELCQLHTVEGFSGAKQGDNLMITPSLVTGVHEDKDVNNDWQNEANTETSLDIRWGITPDWLLNVTINPDFSTVETDNAQLNINNNFALFTQEKRPFFLDNADYFDSNYNLVYTRNINAPNYGAKLTGRQDDHSFGLFVTDDDSTNILIPGNRGSSIASIDGESKAAALRYRYSYNENITMGTVSTIRTAKDYQNIVHSVDTRIRVSTADVFKFQALYSTTEYPDDLFEQFCSADDAEDCQTPPEKNHCDYNNCDYNEQVLRTLKKDEFGGSAFKTSYSHNDRDWYYRLTYDKQSAGFRGDLGFIPRVDYNKFSIGGDRKWYGEPGKWWTKFKIYSDWDITHNDNDELIEKEFDINAQLNASMNSYFRLSYSNRDLVGLRKDNSNLAIDGNTTLFTESQLSLFGEIKPMLGLYFNSRFTYGDAIDYRNNRLGRTKQSRTQINWNVDRHLELKIKHTFNQLNADGANVFNARLTDFRATYQFNVLSFLRFSFIYNNTNRNANNYIYTNPEDIIKNNKSVSSELLYAYKLNPQTAFYLGYSDRHYKEKESFSELEQSQRSVFMKFSYAWIK